MKTKLSKLLHEYLFKLEPNWNTLFPDLEEYLEIHYFLPQETLSLEMGAGYFLLEGIVGKYRAARPLRYILPEELIQAPLHINDTKIRFKALSETYLYKISQKMLYKLPRKYPKLLPLYHQILFLHQHQVDYKLHILEHDKAERLTIFRQKYSEVVPLISRKELAQYLNMSEEYLRKLF